MRYSSAASFRRAIEARLKAESAGRGELLARARKLVAFERFVARIQSDGDGKWLLKGGFALQLRLGARARTTKDVDLAANTNLVAAECLAADRLHDDLVEATAADLGDFFLYEVGRSRELSLRVGPVRAYRFPVRCLLDGRVFELFHADVGVGDPLVSAPVDLPASRTLEFAGIPRAMFRAISVEQHFAEKVHALTRSREGRENTRTRDLADLMLLLDLGLPGATAVRGAVRIVFEKRRTHAVPTLLEDPPVAWEREYEVLAAELELAQHSVSEAMQRLRAYWEGIAWPNE